MAFFTKLFELLVAGPKGIEDFTNILKDYDYSARCSLVWTGDYFAYRCRTCGLTPSMSLCGRCFTAANHEGHDFNKFKSLCGGACDCGDAAVIRPSGICRFHGEDKVANRPEPPRDLVSVLEFLLPDIFSALMFWFWEQCRVETPIILTEDTVPMLFFLHRLHACGWVTQKLMANVLIDPLVYNKLLISSSGTAACQDFSTSVASTPSVTLGEEADTDILQHRTLLDAFLFTTVKLCFPEGLNTLLIGLLAVNEFKDKFLHSYVDHYSRMASSLMVTARSRTGNSDSSLQMNNRIVHISVQLFSGEEPARRMVTERSIHYLIVRWMRNMFNHCHTRLDDRGNMVVNCDGPLMQNNTFWPLTSDFNNLLSHKSITDIFVEDEQFLALWTDVLKYMQFMNCFSMKEGSHIEYETMAFYHGLTMEIEVGVTSMWYLWQHYKIPSESVHCLMYTKACIKCLSRELTFMGCLVAPSTQWPHPIRGPLSLHLPLSRHAACFLHLAVLTHKASLRELMSSFIAPHPFVLRRLMEELANVLLGCHEVIIGYWIRNGQAIRQSIMHYMQSQLCYSMIDLDIFFIQVCGTLLHPVFLLNALVDQSRLLQNFCFHRELLALTGPQTTRNIDRQPMAIEAWLTNLSWILDLRNNLGLTEDELLEKEVVCFLAPDSRKRSDLSCLLPDRCGLPSNSASIDECLKNVATYSAPSCDNASGSLVSGHYTLRPELWHTKFDPVFYSLRITNRRETAFAMEKYRQFCRHSEKIQNSTNLWPPYRLPKALPPHFSDLDNVLQSRHLHYLLFCLLSLFAYGDPLVTEESLSLVIHLLYRAVVSALESRKELAQNSKSMFTRETWTSEPSIPKIGSSQCTEAFLQATNREAELESMQFADAEEVEDEQSDVDTSSETKSTVVFKPRVPPARPLKWDLSIVACPYSTNGDIFENLQTWLSVCRSPNPTVIQATLEESTITTMDGAVIKCTVPNTSSEYCNMSDSLLSLLVKVHARLCWNQTVNGADTSSQTGVQDSAFVDLVSQLNQDVLSSTEMASVCSSFTARCMAILNDSNASNTALGEIIRGNDPSASLEKPESRLISLIAKIPAELRYFAAGRPSYKLPEDRTLEESGQMEMVFGDGTFWVARILDKISEVPSCNTALKIFLERAADPFSSFRQASEQPMSSNGQDKQNPDRFSFLSGVNTGSTSRAQRKRAALERRKRLLDQMASKQRAFTTNFMKDVDFDETTDEITETNELKNENVYECVICQMNSTMGSQTMVLLVMMCESGLMQQMRDYPEPPLLADERLYYTRSILVDPPIGNHAPKLLAVPPPEVRGTGETLCPVSSPHDILRSGPTLILSPPSSSHFIMPIPIQPNTELPMDTSPDGTAVPSVANVESCEPVCYAENRRWWKLALPEQISSSLPLLHSGILLQTCGHAVHLDCFQRYRAQSLQHSGSSNTRWWATCPLCRRDVHHLLPLYHTKYVDFSSPASRSQPSYIQYLRDKIVSLPSVPHSIWSDLVGADEDGPLQRRMMMSRLIGKENESAVLLRSQLETELSVLLAYPSQYVNVVRRSLFQQLMNYLGHVYQSPLHLLGIIDSLSHCFLPSKKNSELEEPFIPECLNSMFAICNDPSDVLLALLPHIWPNEAIFLAVASACICLSYTRALVALVLNQYNLETETSSQRNSIACARERICDLPSPFKNNILATISCLDHLLDRLSLSSPSVNTDAPTSTMFGSTGLGVEQTGSVANLPLLESVARLNSQQLDGSPTSSSSIPPTPGIPETAGLVEKFIINRMLPNLRLTALCLARWQDSFHVRDEGGLSPENLIALSLPFVGAACNLDTADPLSFKVSIQMDNDQEFRALFAFLGISSPKTSSERDSFSTLELIQSAAIFSGLSDSTDGASALDELIHRWLNQISSYSPIMVNSLAPPSDLSVDSAPQILDIDRSGLRSRGARLIAFQHFAFLPNQLLERPLATHNDWIMHLRPLMEIGSQLYPPRLIRPPRAFDDLFNELHLVSCASAVHRFQENVLCLVCGRLLCAICTHLSAVLVEHAFYCEGFAGVALEINTSLVYVSLGPSVCEWGSIYLDIYGEEDLDLKRGKPLFLNNDRFSLLESQWLTHSFRHVLKHWRYI